MNPNEDPRTPVWFQSNQNTDSQTRSRSGIPDLAKLDFADLFELWMRGKELTDFKSDCAWRELLSDATKYPHEVV